MTVNPYDPRDPLHGAYARATGTPTADEQYMDELAEEQDSKANAPPLDEFWKARDELAHIREFAQARRAAPLAVLGVALARVVAAVPPFVVLPALVGAPASLNLFVALVGRSGAGKGAAEQVGAAALIVKGCPEPIGVGSGEGIPHLFARRTKIKGQSFVEQHSKAVLLTVPEIDTLAALQARRGATLQPELRKAWMGEPLGFAYADPDKRLPVAGHRYRLAMVVGVQPARAGALLDDIDAGTPQRYLWLPTDDPQAPDEPPAEPGPPTWEWSGTSYANAAGRVELAVCDTARDQIDAVRLAVLRGQDAALDGHAQLARLKLAAALALLAHRRNVTDDDWSLAGTLMAASDRTRTAIQDELARKEAASNEASGKAEARRAVIVADSIEDDAVKRVSRLLVRKLSEAGRSLSNAELRRRMTSRDRAYFDTATDRLVGAGQIVAEETNADNPRYAGVRYRLAEPP